MCVWGVWMILNISVIYVTSKSTVLSHIYIYIYKFLNIQKFK